MFELAPAVTMSLWKLKLPARFLSFSMAIGSGFKSLKIACFNPVTQHITAPLKTSITLLSEETLLANRLEKNI